MEERQVTIGNTSHPMQAVFLVLATQNPVEQEGTYPLPEAQMDRFMFKIIVNYPKKIDEREILNRMSVDSTHTIAPTITRDELINAKSRVDQIYVDDKIKNYIQKSI